MPLFFETSVGGIELLSQAFQKRHSITHNLGVIDKKYMQQARSAEKEGQEVLISEREIREVIELSKQVFASLHRRMFEKG
jgi:fido (protein-threonine AMPylation protein)